MVLTSKIMNLLTVISITLWIVSTNVHTQRDDFFLPKTMKPIRYTLTTEIINSTNFRGNVLIEVQVLEQTQNVTLHSNNLRIRQDSIKVIDSKGNSVKCLSSTKDKEKEFFIINLEDTLLNNERYNVTIGDFIGSLESPSTGFFRVEYLDLDNTKKYVAVTKFEQMRARKTFPCFDEPGLKATFIINIIRPSDQVSASNMPLLKTIYLGDNRYQDVYQESILMSTYLVAFVVCDYRYTKPNGIIRILAQPEYVINGDLDYALKESNVILEAIEKYTDIKYVLPKLDIVPINHAQFITAMENFGLITFSDTQILCPNTSSTVQWQTCFTYLTHEFTHQWFGNLATQKSWHYMWLSEGFACYFEYHIPHQIKPEWRLDEQFVVKELYSTYNRDIEDEPLNYVYGAESPGPRPKMFDSKGASIIRMTSHFLTEPIFHQALRLYLRKNQYKATEPKDLYDAYEEAIKEAHQESLLENLSIHEILFTWNDIPGHPIVTVTRNYETGDITFSQKNSIDYHRNSIWHIPITFVLENSYDYNFDQKVVDFWFSKQNVTVTSNITDGWLLVNMLGTGYYQVNYDETNWLRLISFLKTEDYKKIPPLNRAQLINDAYYFMSNGDLNPEIFFNLTMYLTQETDYIPILSFKQNMAIIHSDLTKADNKMYKKYLKEVFKASYLKLGFDSDGLTHTDRLLKKEILPLMCSDDTTCQNFLVEHIRRLKATGGLLLSGDFDSILLCEAIKWSTLDDWESVLDQYYSCRRTDFKEGYLHALGCAKEQVIIDRFFLEIFNLNNTMSPDHRLKSLTSITKNFKTGKKSVLEHLVNIENGSIYSNAFGVNAELFLELSPEEYDIYKPLINQVGNVIEVIVAEEAENENITYEFLTWYSKYFS